VFFVTAVGLWLVLGNVRQRQIRAPAIVSIVASLGGYGLQVESGRGRAAAKRPCRAGARLVELVPMIFAGPPSLARKGDRG
jgi:hypothetical protein